MSRENVCYRGHCQFQFQDILRAALWVAFHFNFTNSTLNQISIIRPWRIAAFTDQDCGSHNLWSQNSIEELLAHLADFRTADPRDHVYGCLGLLKRFTGIEEIPPCLKPDYKAPVADVFRDVTKFALEESRHLWLLRFVDDWGDGEDNREWPSWVPRWERSSHGAENALRLPNGHFRAGGGVSLNALPSWKENNPNILDLWGFTVDSITAVTPVLRLPPWKAETAREEFKKFMEPARAIIRQTRNHRTEDEVKRAIASTIVASCDFSLDYMDENECAKWYEELSDPSRDLDPSAEEFWGTMDLVCHHRCLFATASGLIGLGPATTVHDDLVAILYGSDLPFVLRRAFHPPESSHRLVGACYVHGVMKGEAVEMHQSKGKTDEIFSLA